MKTFKEYIAESNLIYFHKLIDSGSGNSGWFQVTGELEKKLLTELKKVNSIAAREIIKTTEDYSETLPLSVGDAIYGVYTRDGRVNIAQGGNFTSAGKIHAQSELSKLLLSSTFSKAK